MRTYLCEDTVLGLFVPLPIADGWAIRRPLLPYLLALSACAAVTLVNPYGIEYWRYLVDAVAMPRPEIPEWAPLFRTSKTGLPLPAVAYLLLIMGVSAALVLRSRQTDIPAVSCLAATLFLGLLHARHIVFFLISASVFVPGLSGLRAARKPDLATLLGKKGVSIVSLSALALLAAFALPRLHDSRPLTMKVPSVPDAEGKGMYYPVGAADHIRERGYSGNVLTLFEWGEYLLWTLHPQCRVALDGRYETVYPKRISESYFEFYNATGKWDELIREYPRDMILVKSDSRLRFLLDGSPAWKLDFEDPGSSLFVSKDFILGKRQRSAYWLTWGGVPGRRFAVVPQPSGPPGAAVASAPATVFEEGNKAYYPGATQEEVIDNGAVPGEAWIWEFYYPGTTLAHTFLVDTVDRSGGQFTFSARVWGTTSGFPPVSHRARFWLNDSLLGDYAFGQRQGAVVALTFPAAWLRDGANTVTVKSIDTQTFPNQFYLDWFAIDHRRFLRARADLAVFDGPSSSGAGPANRLYFCMFVFPNDACNGTCHR